jgi:hypothetical protein
MPRSLWCRKVEFRVHKSPPLVHLLSRYIKVHTPFCTHFAYKECQANHSCCQSKWRPIIIIIIITIATTITSKSNNTVIQEDRNCKNYRITIVDCKLYFVFEKISKLTRLHQKQKYWPERKASSSLQKYHNYFYDTLRTISTLQFYGIWHLLLNRELSKIRLCQFQGICGREEHKEGRKGLYSENLLR